MVDQVLTIIFKTSNKNQLVSSLNYWDYIVTNGDSRASLNNKKNKRCICRDGNWFKSCPRYDIQCLYYDKKGGAKFKYTCKRTSLSEYRNTNNYIKPTKTIKT